MLTEEDAESVTSLTSAGAVIQIEAMFEGSGLFQMNSSLLQEKDEYLLYENSRGKTCIYKVKGKYPLFTSHIWIAISSLPRANNVPLGLLASLPSIQHAEARTRT